MDKCTLVSDLNVLIDGILKGKLTLSDVVPRLESIRDAIEEDEFTHELAKDD